MKRRTLNTGGFTLIELLTIVVLLSVFAACLLPTFSGPRQAYGAVCMSHQKQIGIGFLVSASDNGNAFPWQRPATNGGTLEVIGAGNALPHFQVLSNFARVTLLVCPTDKGRSASSNYAELTNRNISYFINVDAGTTNSPVTTVLTGDRNLQANGHPVATGLFRFQPGLEMKWTQELHPNAQNSGNKYGILGFADGHAEVVRNNKLTSVLAGGATSSTRLLVP